MLAWGPPLRASEMMRTERRLRKYSKMLFTAREAFHPSQYLLPPLARKQYRVSPPGIAA